MNTNISALLARLRSELFADKKKSAVLGALALVFSVVAGRLLLTKSVPADAVAHELAPSMAGPAPAAGGTPLPSGAFVRPLTESPPPEPPSQPQVTTPVSLPPHSATDGAAQDTPIPAKVARVDGAPRRAARDLFTSPEWTSFGRSATSRPAEGRDDGGDFWAQFAGSLAEHQARNRRELAKTEADARALQLTATMSGPHPSAYISGRLVHAGDAIDSFSVVSIEDGAVTLDRDGHRFLLRIK